MKQQEKDLLLKDLCARLPYKVIINYSGYEECNYTLAAINSSTINNSFPLENCKPYLRPMSSITEEEMKEYERLHKGIAELNDIAFIALNDFLNSHHFDYRGLIPLGLAIEVTKENNPYKD